MCETCLHLWTIKMPTSRRDVSHKVTVIKVILNDRWSKMRKTYVISKLRN
jgi:hypothetical protein